jgi:hypothetical protein
MTLHSGDTIKVQATIGSPPADPDTQVVTFYDSAGRVRKIDNAPTKIGTGVYQSQFTTLQLDPEGTWYVLWQETTGGVTASSELSVTIED